MASDNWKREAWVRFAAEVAAVGVSLDGGLSTETTTNATLAHHCGAVADALLSEVEQREREGRFGIEDAPPPAGYSLKGWANPNAVKRYEKIIAEAKETVSRRTQDRDIARDERDRLIHARQSDAKHLSDVCAAKDRAESLLKEALGWPRYVSENGTEWCVDCGTSRGHGHTDECAIGKTLARARQEGFSDGE